MYYVCIIEEENYLEFVKTDSREERDEFLNEYVVKYGYAEYKDDEECFNTHFDTRTIKIINLETFLKESEMTSREIEIGRGEEMMYDDNYAMPRMGSETDYDVEGNPINYSEENTMEKIETVKYYTINDRGVIQGQFSTLQGAQDWAIELNEDTGFEKFNAYSEKEKVTFDNISEMLTKLAITGLEGNNQFKNDINKAMDALRNLLKYM